MHPANHPNSLPDDADSRLIQPRFASFHLLSAIPDTTPWSMQKTQRTSNTHLSNPGNNTSSNTSSLGRDVLSMIE